MNLLFVRHAHAEDREEWAQKGHDDFLRPLTKKGISKFALSLSALKSFVPNIDHIFCSQLTRSIQTAEILHNFYENSQLKIISQLNPNEETSSLIKLTSKFPSEHTLCFVGHQPDLSQLCNSFMHNPLDNYLKFKKGGMALLQLEDKNCEFHWMLNQRQLSAMAEKANSIN